MITLNINKSLVEVDGWNEITQRAGFRTNLDPADHQLAAVIGRYAFKDEIHCGLSDCHQPHGKGYIVSTTAGFETNIGKDCGKKYFGIDFETMSRQFDRDVQEQENRSRVLGFSLRLEDFFDAVSKLRTAGGWVYQQSRALLTPSKGCPAQVIHRVTRMIRERINVVTTQRLATSDELDLIEVREGKRPREPVYIDEPVATIEAFEYLYPENDFRKVVVLDIEEQLKKFRELDLDGLQFRELQYWSRWFGTLDGLIETAQHIVQLGDRMLNVENLRPLGLETNDATDSAMFEQYLRAVANRPTKTEDAP